MFLPLLQWAYFAQALELRVRGDATQVGETVRRMVNGDEPRLLANSRSVLVADQLARGLTRD